MLFVACGGGDEPQPQPTPQPNEPQPNAAVVFARGADISWYTEMKADGRRFYNAQGEERELPVLLKEMGLNAVRLRVWVDPRQHGVDFSDKADVVAKARAAHEAGLTVMIDFHYSDTWADPAQQQMPAAWRGLGLPQLQQAVVAHTTEVLEALKAAGVAPQWVQVGNETNNGMLHPVGKADTAPRAYAALFRSGAEAVKRVFPKALVVAHLARGYDEGLFRWNLDLLRQGGAVFDVVGMSVYPSDYRYWKDGKAVAESFWSETEGRKVELQSEIDLVDKALANLDAVARRYNCPVMVVETGMPVSTPEASARIIAHLMNGAKQRATCAGVFYWEPQTDGTWRPQSYAAKGWRAYDKGAFTTAGRPTAILAPFGQP